MYWEPFSAPLIQQAWLPFWKGPGFFSYLVPCSSHCSETHCTLPNQYGRAQTTESRTNSECRHKADVCTTAHAYPGTLLTLFSFSHLQKEQLHTKGRPFRGMSEEEVFTEVANLFRGQEDLLSEFGQFLPEAKRSLVSAKCPGSCL